MCMREREREGERAAVKLDEVNPEIFSAALRPLLEYTHADQCHAERLINWYFKHARIQVCHHHCATYSRNLQKHPWHGSCAPWRTSRVAQLCHGLHRPLEGGCWWPRKIIKKKFSGVPGLTSNFCSRWCILSQMLSLAMRFTWCFQERRAGWPARWGNLKPARPSSSDHLWRIHNGFRGEVRKHLSFFSLPLSQWNFEPFQHL